MKNPWDDYAKKRHIQIESGIDISYDEILVKTIMRILSENETRNFIKYLDVGCSTGILISRLVSSDINIVGIDNSKESVKLAKEYTKGFENVNIVEASILDYSPGNEFLFEVIICNMVLHSVDNLLGALNSCYRLLEKDGMIIISIPHPCFWAEYKGLNLLDQYSYIETRIFNNDFVITNDPKPFPQKTPYIHRPISTYINSLILSGFELNHVIEPYPDSTTMKKYKQPWKDPHFLFLIASKKGA